MARKSPRPTFNFPYPTEIVVFEHDIDFNMIRLEVRRQRSGNFLATVSHTNVADFQWHELLIWQEQYTPEQGQEYAIEQTWSAYHQGKRS